MTQETVGRFTLQRKLPAGGMGRVFEAEDSNGSRRVALKLIDLGADADSVQIVRAERLGAELQSRLCAIDERVTSIFEFGEMTRYFYIVMEYVEGRDLSEVNAGVGMPAMEAARIAQEILEVLNHAHTFTTTLDGRSIQGVVHGDLKPRNIRLTAEGSVKVLDFGIAKALSLTRSFTQNVFGSVQYSSPARVRTGEVDFGSDLWAVAVVLYEMLAGRPYFQAGDGSRLEHLIRNYDHVLRLDPQWPESVRKILARSLHPDLRARYNTAADFAADLQAFRTGKALHGATDAIWSSDNEATRRVPGADEATRRTQAGQAMPTMRAAGGQTAGTIPQPQWRPVPVRPMARRRAGGFRTFLRAVGALVLAFMLSLVYLTVNEYFVWGSAHQLARDLSSEKQQNLDAAWRQYQSLSSRSHLPISLWAAMSELQKHLVADADHTILRYRGADSGQVTEAEWTRARSDVSRALELSPGDKGLHAKLSLLDGHLARLRGAAEQDSRLLEDARQDFQTAAASMKKSPDPWLGLAPLYIYSLHDLARGEAAIRQAARLDHGIGKRETRELADGYLDRAKQSIASGDRATTKGEATRDYRQALSDLAHARHLYQSTMPSDAVSASLEEVIGLMKRISSAR